MTVYPKSCVHNKRSLFCLTLGGKRDTPSPPLMSAFDRIQIDDILRSKVNCFYVVSNEIESCLPVYFSVALFLAIDFNDLNISFRTRSLLKMFVQHLHVLSTIFSEIR